MPDKETYLETERRLTRLESDMKHNAASLAQLRTDHTDLKAKVDGIDKRTIVLCALASGGVSGAVQLLLQFAHTTAK